VTSMRKLARDLRQSMKTKEDNNFHWILKGKLASAESPTLDKIVEYKQDNINAIVNLQECKRKMKGLWGADYDMPRYDPNEIRKFGITPTHIPVVDMTAPTKKQFDQFIKFVDEKGRTSLVHCYAGIGRTGCMVAAYYGYINKLGGEAAVDGVRNIYKYFIQTDEQEEATIAYIDSL
jgi:atypical dual specificity phosphatase